jgi:O-antigen ligase
LLASAEGLILVVSLLISNRFSWLCVFEINKPVFWCENGTVVTEFFVYLGLVLLLLVMLLRSPLRRPWEEAWRRNPILIAFLLWCAASAFWSVSPIHTVYRVSVVLFSALVASYLGIRYSDSEWIKILMWFSGAAILLSYLLVWLLPGAAIMSTLGLEGAWRGAFSHKNYAGSIVAYGTSVLALALVLQTRRAARMALGALIVLAAIFIHFTLSATGMLVLVVLLALLAAGLLWQKHRALLDRRHYVAAGFLLAAAATLGIIFRDVLLRLLGRSPTFTGRIPLWTFVIAEVREHNPWLGYGLWTVWRIPEFCIRAGHEAGWAIPIIDAHNGYLDILLYLGAIGLLLFLLLLAQTAWRVTQYLRRSHSPASMWVLITLGYLLVTNLAISFFFQFETFHWLLLVAVIFMCSRTEAAVERPTDTSA